MKWLYTLEHCTEVLRQLGFNEKDVGAWRKKFKALRDNSRLRGVKCLLSFRQYMKLAKRAGIETPEEIGKGVLQFCVSRVGDSGNYEVGNCRFKTVRENLDERRKNGGNSVVGRKNKVNSSYRYSIRGPTGRTYVGLCLKDFCKKKSLNYRRMQRVCGGLEISYQGFSGSYIKDEQK